MSENQVRENISHSIKSLENILGEIKYWQSPEDIREIITTEINSLRRILRERKYNARIIPRCLRFNILNDCST